MSPLQPWIDDFLLYMQDQRGCSPRTRDTYRISLTDCADVLTAFRPGLTWEQVDTLLVRRWVAWMSERGYAPNTINRSLASLRSFFKFLLREERVSVDPARLVRNPKAPKRLPTFVQENEMDRLFDHYPFSDDYVGLRDRTILLLLYHTGVRAAELLGLNTGDVELTRGAAHLRVTGKGNKQRIVPFGEELRQALLTYLDYRAETFADAVLDEPHALFLTPRCRRLAYSALLKMVRTTLGAVTTQKKRSPHVLRHSFATAMLAHGANLESIQQLLGHERVDTTAIYTHIPDLELKEIYAKAHPHSGG